MRIIAAVQAFRAGDVEADWLSFARGLPTDWTSGLTTTSVRYAPNIKGDLSVLDQLPATSDRVAILVEVSQSCCAVISGGLTMGDAVTPAIGRLLRSLDQTGRSPWCHSPRT